MSGVEVALPVGFGGSDLNGLHLVKVWYLQSASAYVVRKSAIIQLRDIYLKVIAEHRPFDQHMTSIRRDVQWYAFRPALGTQRPSSSDILRRHVDYGCEWHA